LITLLLLLLLLLFVQSNQGVLGEQNKTDYSVGDFLLVSPSYFYNYIHMLTTITTYIWNSFAIRTHLMSPSSSEDVSGTSGPLKLC
jgi:hypothetical protein